MRILLPDGFSALAAFAHLTRPAAEGRNGDTTSGSVTIYRVVDGKAKLMGLITPSPALVR